MEDLLLRTRPPNPELVDPIETAFLEGQTNGLKPDLAYSWLRHYELATDFAQICTNLYVLKRTRPRNHRHI